MDPGGGIGTHHIGGCPIENKNWIKELSEWRIKNCREKSVHRIQVDK